MINKFLLTEKNILITGASSGIGMETAKACDAAGAYLALVGRNEKELKNCINTLSPGKHKYYVCDITDDLKLNELFKSIHEDFGRLSGLVHSAGIEITSPLRSTKKEMYQNIMDVNTIAGFELSRYATKKKNRGESLSIVFLSSIMSVVGTPTQTAYAMSKGGLVAGARAAALELASKNVRVNCISPGFVKDTKMSNDLLVHLPENAQQALRSKYPLGLGEVEDIANSCLYLLSDASRWITGINLVVDGGYSAQ